MSIDTTEVTCPSCGTVSHFEELGRDGDAFCRTCDFPLFWARAPRLDGGLADSGDEGLRRLPGTGGRLTLATVSCPVCTEPNNLSATICVRCGADIYTPPAPPVEEPAPPAPEPEPVAEVARRRVIWPWVALLVLLIAGVVALVLILT